MQTQRSTNLKSFRVCLTALAMFSFGALLVLGAIIFLENSASIVKAVQQQERLLHRLPIERGEPIVITDIKVNGQNVSFDRKFAGGDDWMKDLVFTVKNRSDKRILLVALQFQFPRPPGSAEKISLGDVFFGNPELLARKPTPEERSTGIAPGQTERIQLTPERFEAFRSFLTATGYASSIEQINFRINEVLFEDDTMWGGGELLKRDKQNLNTWTRVEASGLGKARRN